METADIGEAFDVPAIIRGLNGDLIALRNGQITVKEAQTRAELAKQIFNGLRMVVQTQKYLSERARKIDAIEGNAKVEP
ncbi:hypothetical protein [Rhizobium rhizogenes]|uniref:hypothetical protein n=1 Tax=Rhizobium rhizogenes TaxID=359 RepID=UPI001573E5F7|nr:hypothetical protein [Rhizobium rhizogenes]NTI27622.1 hypothetical protein [Rhizobium rhizogenes]